MSPGNTNLALRQQAAAPVRTAIPAGDWLEFAQHLARNHSITGDLLSKFGSADKSGKGKKLRDLWELTNLSAADFADEVARLCKLRRMTWAHLVPATSLSPRISG